MSSGGVTLGRSDLGPRQGCSCAHERPPLVRCAEYSTAMCHSAPPKNSSTASLNRWSATTLMWSQPGIVKTVG